MLRVLMVESDPTLAWLYREELRDAGFLVEITRDLKSAKAAMRAHRPHVLVTDIGSMGRAPEAWLPQFRREFSLPVVLLGEGKAFCGQRRETRIVPKTSDIKPLIDSLRGHAVKVLWRQAAAMPC